MSDWYLEQQFNIKFCVKLGMNESDICTVLCKAYRGEATKKSSVSEWHKRFIEDSKNVEDDERCSSPRSHRTDENAERTQNLANLDKR